MGLDASVMCQCFRLGLCSAPPVDASRLRLDEDGWLGLTSGTEAEQLAVDQWQHSACVHEDMVFYDADLSNWSGYRSFQQALEQAGWQHFPTLREYLPNSNDGSLSASAAGEALRELDRFHSLDLGKEIVLVNSQTGQVLYDYIAPCGGRFVFGGQTGVDVGFDPAGLVLVERDTERVLFRATRVEQIEHPDGQTTLIDRDTGQRYLGQVRVGDEGDRFLHTECRALDPEKFAFITRPLRALLEASLETGNPVRWC